MAVLKWLNKRPAASGLVAFCPGPKGVAAAAIKRARDAQPVLAWAEFQPVDRSPAARSAVYASVLKRHQVGTAPCTSLLQVGEYSLVLVEPPDVPPDELRAAVRWRVKDLIDFNADEAIVDVFRVPTLKGGQDMLYAVVARQATVRALVDEISASGAALAFVDIPEFAIRNLSALMPEDVGGLAFIHLEEQVGLITITRQGTLYLSRRFDYGRARLLEGGAQGVSPAVEGLLDAIVIEVQRSLDFYESRFGQPPVQGVAMAALGEKFDGVAAYLGSQLGVPARMIRLRDLIEMEATPQAAYEGDCLTAVGAALRFGEAAP